MGKGTHLYSRCSIQAGDIVVHLNFSEIMPKTETGSRKEKLTASDAHQKPCSLVTLEASPPITPSPFSFKQKPLTAQSKVAI